MNRIFLLLFAWCLMQSGLAQKYKDALAQNAVGKVKFLINDNWGFCYSRNGVLVDMLTRDDAEHETFSLERDGEGRIVKFTLYADESRSVVVYTEYYEYNGDNLIRLRNVFKGMGNYEDEVFVDYYYREGQCVGYRTYTGNLEQLYKYENIKIDDQGNWISRDCYKASAGADDSEGWEQCKKEKRQIIYWVDSTDSLPK